VFPEEHEDAQARVLGGGLVVTGSDQLREQLVPEREVRRAMPVEESVTGVGTGATARNPSLASQSAWPLVSRLRPSASWMTTTPGHGPAPAGVAA
jgi:hypothetical protein